MAEEKINPVQTQRLAEDREGQAQERTPYPKAHDGKHFFDESRTVTDHVVRDVTSDLAVQVPEGVGASTYGHRSPLGDALAVGTPEAQFEKNQSDADKQAKADAKKS